MLSKKSSDFRPPYQVAAEQLRDNAEQWQAYESKGHCVVLAGPGSGKTRTLTTKFARMLAEDVRAPQGIACITYSTECADELRRRFDRLGVRESRNVYIGTIHSFCLKHLLMPFAELGGLGLPDNFSVALPSEKVKIQEDLLPSMYGRNKPPFDWRTDFDKYRRTQLDRTAASWFGKDAATARFIEAYESSLRKKGLIDFDDMVLLGLRLIQEHEWIRRCLRARFPILVVDEYQDLGEPLHRIVLALCFQAGVRLFAVGDPDQSIYGFAGAKPELLAELAETKGVEKVQLRFNYRCGQTIIDASEVALGEDRGYQSYGDHKGTIDFYKMKGGLDHQAQYICAEIIPNALQRRHGRCLGDVAVLYVDRNDGEVIERAANQAGLKTVRMDKGASYERTPLNRWIESCAAWCSGGWQSNSPRLSNLLNTWENFNTTVRAAEDLYELRLTLVRFLFSHRAGQMPAHVWLGKLQSLLLSSAFSREKSLKDERSAFEVLFKAFSAEGKLQDLTVVALGGKSGRSDQLTLITLHSAKGLEFDVVVMMGMDQGRIPSWQAKTAESKREPRRVFYVGLTRARHEVHLTCSGFTVSASGARFNNGASEFLREVHRNLKQSQE